MGEYMGFGMAGVVGGFIVGYMFAINIRQKRLLQGGKTDAGMAFRRPVTGILTTIGFFVFLIIGRKLELRQMKQTRKLTLMHVHFEEHV